MDLIKIILSLAKQKWKESQLMIQEDPAIEPRIILCIVSLTLGITFHSQLMSETKPMLKKS
jgi:hypothetical protein